MCRSFFFVLFILISIPVAHVAGLQEQDTGGKNDNPTGNTEVDPAEVSTPPTTVSVETVVDDDKIAKRLKEILGATNWFQQVDVEVKQGVAFVNGTTDQDEHKAWAGNLARNTEDVVAVVNQISVADKPFWDFSESYDELASLGRDVTRGLPQVLFAIVILVLTWFSTRLAVWVIKPWVNRRVQNGMLRSVLIKVLAIPFILLGIYLALRVSGLSRLALTVLGGTGVFGLVIGIAFRDIAENFLASLLISTQRPFREDDLIEVDGKKGYVQKVSTRGTTIMTQDGNHIQIPNSTIYKSVVTNFTSNPRARIDFVVGISYDAPVADVQQLLFDIILKHPAVIQDPEPMVLVESLGASTVNLRILAWIDSRNHGPLKVRSSLIRMTKNALVANGVEIPDEAREIIIKGPVDIKMLEANGATNETTPIGQKESRIGIFDAQQKSAPGQKPEASHEPASIAAEGGLASDDEVMLENAKKTRSPDESENLLDSD